MYNIRESYPNLNIDNVEKITTGQNNDIFIINKEYIFRFPKYQDGIDALLTETEILKKIDENITLNIPNPIYYSFKTKKVGSVFVGYKMIKGKPLMKKTFLDIKDKEKIAIQLAEFLKELHSNEIKDKVSKVISETDIYNKWDYLYDRIKNKLFSYMNDKAKKEVERNFEEFLDNINNRINTAYIHGDFGPTNILYDDTNKRINGIIDFGESYIGDPAVDFAALIGPFGYGKDFILNFKKIYLEVEEYISRAEFYASTFALQEALFGFENNDKEAFNNGIQIYE